MVITTVGTTHIILTIRKRMSHKKKSTMLGIKTRRDPVRGDVARQIRDAVIRIATGKLSEHELASVKKSQKALKRYKIQWEI